MKSTTVGPTAVDPTVARSNRSVRKKQPVVDAVALGAHRDLRSGPHGVTELGRAFLAVHGGDLDAALGQLLVRIARLERGRPT